MKTRKKIVIGLCSFYLLSVTGIALNLHFCGNELSSVNTRHKTHPTEASCAAQQETPAKAEESKPFSVSSFFTPVIGEFMEYLMPGLFFKIQH